MEVTSIQNGIIIDHVPAGTALKVLEYLKIDPSKTKLALIMNTDSHMYGTKDIIKIEDETESIDLDVLGLVARTATVGIVRGGKIVEKKKPTLPEHVVNIIKCVNPRCVTTTEPAVQMFHLVHSDRQEYRTAISSLKQSGISGDTNLSECKSYLDQEVTRINNKIEATSQDIQDLSSRIDDAESNS